MNDEPTVRPAPLVWWAGGLLLGLTQVLAIAAKKPLGVSTQFVVAEGVALHEHAPEYAKDHPLIGKPKYKEFGYGWWLDVGLVGGAFLAALFAGRWRPKITTAWWRANNRGAFTRLLAGFAGGFLILLGARLAHGCTSGQFASGWAQLSVSAVPFTVTLFGFGVLTAWLFHRKSPTIER